MNNINFYVKRRFFTIISNAIRNNISLGTMVLSAYAFSYECFHVLLYQWVFSKIKSNCARPLCTGKTRRWIHLNDYENTQLHAHTHTQLQLQLHDLDCISDHKS